MGHRSTELKSRKTYTPNGTLKGKDAQEVWDWFHSQRHTHNEIYLKGVEALKFDDEIEEVEDGKDTMV